MTAAGRSIAAAMRVWRSSGAYQDLAEAYVSGQCMMLAIAIHERLGWPITVAIDNSEQQRYPNGYIRHAWVDSPDGRSYDIDGFSRSNMSEWRFGCSVRSGLDAAAVHEIIGRTLGDMGKTYRPADSSEDISAAREFVDRYLIAELA